MVIKVMQKHCIQWMGILFGVLLLTCPAAAEQEVTVTWPLEEGQSAMSVKDEALEKGFAEAAVQETLQILPGTLSEQRQELLVQYLLPHARELVLSYKETTFEQTWTELFMTLEVDINRSLLKKRLKKAGVFYTSTEPWPYSLVLSGSDPAAWMALEDLQTLSGLTVREGASPVLHLKRTEAGLWQGELTTMDRVIKEYGQELDRVWYELWSQFFSLPEVQQRVMQSTTLMIQGWSSIGEMQEFQRGLLQWDSLLEQALLTHMEMTSEGILAQWSIRARDIALFEQRLERMLDDHLTFAVHAGGGEDEGDLPEDNG